MAATLLSPNELQNIHQTLPHWQLVNGQLERRFQFSNFVGAWGFMTQVALIAEAMNHHPDWSNVYANVTIRLSTHDLGGISTLDLTLAEAIDRLL